MYYSFSRIFFVLQKEILGFFMGNYLHSINKNIFFENDLKLILHCH